MMTNVVITITTTKRVNAVTIITTMRKASAAITTMIMTTITKRAKGAAAIITGTGIITPTTCLRAGERRPPAASGKAS